MQIRIVGTELQIEVMIAIFAVLATKGAINYTFDGNYVPRRQEPGRYSAHLKNITIHNPPSPSPS